MEAGDDDVEVDEDDDDDDGNTVNDDNDIRDAMSPWTYSRALGLEPSFLAAVGVIVSCMQRPSFCRFRRRCRQRCVTGSMTPSPATAAGGHRLDGTVSSTAANADTYIHVYVYVYRLTLALP